MGEVLTGLLALLKLIPQLIALSEKIGATIKEKKLDVWLDDLHKTIDRLDQAHTPEEKRAAARDLVDLTRRL